MRQRPLPGRLPDRLLGAWGDPLGPEAVTRVGSVAFCALIAVAAFWDLGARSLHTLDLPRFGVLAREMIRSGEWLVPHRYGEIYANKPPLMIWMIAGPAALVGEVTPFLVRLPSALGFVLVALSASAWGRLRTGAPAVGRAAALLVLGTFALTRFGREGRPDMLATGLAVAGTYFLDRLAMGRGRRADAWIAGGLLGLALLAKGPALLLFPLLVLVLPDGRRRTVERVRASRLPVVLGTAVGVALLWLVPATLAEGWHYARMLVLDQATDRIAGAANHEEPANYYFVRLVTDGGAPWSPLYLAALLAVSSRALGRTRSLALGAFLAVALFSLVPTKHLRYVLFAYPALAIAVGWIVLRLVMERPAGRLWPLVQRAGGVALVIVGILMPWAVARMAGGEALVPALVPAIGLCLLGVAALRPAADDAAAAARRRVVGGLLVSVVLLLSTYWIVRDRYRVRALAAFDAAVAEALSPGVPLLTLEPIRPDDVFHAAPAARRIRTAAEVRSGDRTGPLLVLAVLLQRGELEAAWGGPGTVLLDRPLGDDGPQTILLSFPAR